MEKSFPLSVPCIKSVINTPLSQEEESFLEKSICRTAAKKWSWIASNNSVIYVSVFYYPFKEYYEVYYERLSLKYIFSVRFFVTYGTK